MKKIISFGEALGKSDSGNRHILLGNGFSIDCRRNIFDYEKLYDRANFNTIPRAKKAFDLLGTFDFERVIKALMDFANLAPAYGLEVNEPTTDANAVRDLLVSAIANSHPNRPAEINESEYRQCRMFLNHFRRVFTLNYDLLLYWSLMQTELQPEVACDDGFRSAGEGNSVLEWQESKVSSQTVFYLHGALHLYESLFSTRKRVLGKLGIPLIDQIQDALESDQFPLFVCEGTTEEKRASIFRSRYLTSAFQELGKVSGSLFVHGHSLRLEDGHILDQVKASSISNLFIGIYGDHSTPSNIKLIERAVALAHSAHCQLFLFDSESASVWR